MESREDFVSDYERIKSAIEFICDNVGSQPTLNEIAAHIQLSPSHFQRLFSRWAGVSPKRYLQVLTVERAKQLLAESRSLLEVSGTLGLSSGSRLYDHFVQLEAVTPGEYRTAGQGMDIDYGVHDTPFGEAFIALTERGICSLEFLHDSSAEVLLQKLSGKWKHSSIHENQNRTRGVVDQIFGSQHQDARPFTLQVSGTNFQVKIWQALLRIPPGMVVSYSDIARFIGSPKSARAVGTAIGDNPVAFLIPCHRVIRQNGNLGGYHWGESRLHAIHAWESARKDL